MPFKKYIFLSSVELHRSKDSNRTKLFCAPTFIHRKLSTTKLMFMIESPFKHLFRIFSLMQHCLNKTLKSFRFVPCAYVTITFKTNYFDEYIGFFVSIFRIRFVLSPVAPSIFNFALKLTNINAFNP